MMYSTEQEILQTIKSGRVPPSTPENLAIIEQAKSDSLTATSERLYIVEPRSASGLYIDDAYNSRGETASIRLITTNNFLGGVDINTRKQLGGIDDASFNELVGLTNTSFRLGGYDRFLLTSCEVAYSEKTQVTTTFGDNEVIYFFGKNPVIMNLQGVLIDSLTNDWFGSFINLYHTFLRGSQLAKNFEMLELVLPNMKVIGSILSLSHQQNSARDTDIPFALQFYAKKIEMLPQPGMSRSIQNLSVNSIFTNADRSSQGANGASIASSTAGGFSEPVEPEWINKVIGATSGQLTLGYAIFRNNIISPVVSVIASLTRIVQIITKDITKIVSSFTAPINALLRDVTSIANQATAVANLIEGNAANIGSLLATPGINLRTTLSALKNTAGVISRLPENVSSAFKRNFHRGRIRRGAAILSSGNQGRTGKIAVLSSGAPHTAQNSFII